MDEYATPLGNITLDRTTIDELYATGAFEWMQKSVDEEEHSIEMQLPYIYKMMQGYVITYLNLSHVSLKGKRSLSCQC